MIDYCNKAGLSEKNSQLHVAIIGSGSAALMLAAYRQKS